MTANWDSGILVLSGEFDLANQDLVRDKIGEAVGHGLDEITVDMTAVTFADSSALGCLLDAVRIGINVTVRPSPIVDRALRLLGLHEILAITE